MAQRRAFGGCMAEENDGQDTGAEASGSGVDPAAVALALGGASREKADAFLDDQRIVLLKQGALIEDQRHHLNEQFKQLAEQLKQLRLNIWQQRMGVLLRILTGFVGLAVAAGLALMIWNESQSSGLLIEPFSVPPDLAQRGMTGQVVAAKLLDHLSEMQAQTTSERPAETYANDWGQAGIKLDIPETGISVTELDDFLREKLGHDTHITGEIVRTASGVSLTARTGVEGAESVTGSEADLGGRVRQLSEKVYRLTQPYRYAIYLASHDRLAEAVPVLKAVAETGPTRLDPAFGYGDWSWLSAEQDGINTALRLSQRAMAVEPDNVLAQANLGALFDYKSLPEQGVRENQKALTLLASNKLGMYSGREGIAFKGSVQDLIDPRLGDFRDAAQIDTQVVQAGTSYSPDTSAQLANMEADEHDLAAARATLVDTVNYRFDYTAGDTAFD